VLRNEQAEIEQRLEEVRETIDRLTAISKRGAGRVATQGRRNLSSEGREAISRAAKKRWAAYRRQKRRASS